MSIKKFIIGYLLYNVVLVAIGFGLKEVSPQIITHKFWLVFGFLSILTLIAYIVAYLGIKKNPETGVFSIMGSIVLKMLFAMGFVLIYSLKTKEKDVVFVLNFFSLYLLFTCFEIFGLLRNLRHQNK